MFRIYSVQVSPKSRTFALSKEGKATRWMHDGRWGYLRDGRWYYYDCFYEPAYYYSRPVAHFHSHCLTPRELRIAGAIAGTAAVATLISALVH